MNMKRSGSTGLLPLTLMSLPILLLLFACQRGARQEKTELLPEAGPNERNFSAYKPANAYAEAGKGLLVRTILETEGPPGMRVQVRDFLVAPGQRTDNVSFHGAAVVEVRSGAGSVIVGEKRQELVPGRTFSISEGQSLTLENKTALPIALRVYLFTGR